MPGSTTLLKLIAGRISHTGGAVTYNGSSLSDLQHAGVYVRKLATFGSAADEHEVHLTVREVFSFAYDSAVATDTLGVGGSGAAAAPRGDLEAGGAAKATSPEAPPSLAPLTPDEMIAAMGLQTSANTIAGGLLARGLSGGEKRRLTVGEALIANARVVALDHPTDGLDSTTAFKVIGHCTSQARRTGGIFIAALQQPTPETLRLFDDVILMAGGEVLFQGPLAGPGGFDAYFASLGYARPSYADLAEWALELACNLAGAASSSLEDRFGKGADAAAAAAADSAPAEAVVPWLHTHAALAAHWASSTALAAMTDAGAGAAPAAGGVVLATPFAQAQYGRPHAKPFFPQLAITLRREIMVARRNWVYIAARLFLTSVMGVMLGSVFPWLNTNVCCEAVPTTFQEFFSVSLYSLTFITFICNASIPFAYLSRGVVYKHTNASLYGEWTYVLANTAAQAPLHIASDILFATPLYFLAQYAQDGGRWVFFCLVVILQDLLSSSLYRAMTFASPTDETAMIGSGLFTAVALSLGNYFVINTQVGWWLRWLIFVSPFFWSETAAVNNEFSSAKYSGLYPGSTTDSYATVYMRTFDFPFSMGAKWGGIGVMLAWWLVGGFALQWAALKFVRYDAGAPGTRRAAAADAGSAEEQLLLTLTSSPPAVDSVAAGGDGSLALKTAVSSSPGQAMAPHTASVGVLELAKRLREHAASRKAGGAKAAIGHLPCAAVTLTFDDLSYFVTVKAKGRAGTEEKQLLRSVQGFAEPGMLTALMGASGEQGCVVPRARRTRVRVSLRCPNAC